MTVLRVLGGRHAAVAVFAAVGAVQIALIAFGNMADYATNYDFVRHVLAMDTTFQSPNMMWRAITSPGAATAAYIAIIVWETAAAAVLSAATVAWVRALFTGRGAETARRLSSLGWLMWVALFGLGFIALGGEWFQMWQSQEWNGLDAALQNLTVAAFGLILAHLPERAPEPDAVR